jgi:SRSO17 transposase
LRLNIKFYQKADSLPQGEADPKLNKKPDIAWELINRALEIGYRAEIVLIDADRATKQLFYNRYIK